MMAPATLQDRAKCDSAKCGRHCPLQSCGSAEFAVANPGQPATPVAYTTAMDRTGAYMLAPDKGLSLEVPVSFYKCGGQQGGVFDCDSVGAGISGSMDRYKNFVSVPSESGFHLISVASALSTCTVDNGCLRACPDPQITTKESLVVDVNMAYGDQPLENVGKVLGQSVIHSVTTPGGQGPTCDGTNPSGNCAYRSFQISTYVQGQAGCTATSSDTACPDPGSSTNRAGVISFGFPDDTGDAGLPKCQYFDAWVYETGSSSYGSPAVVEMDTTGLRLLVGTEDFKVHCIPLDTHGMPNCPNAGVGPQPWPQHDASAVGVANIFFYNASTIQNCVCPGSWPYHTQGSVRSTPVFGPPTSKTADTAWLVSYDGTLHAISIADGTVKCTATMRGHSASDPFLVASSGSSYFVSTSDSSGYLYMYDEQCALQWELLVNDPGAFDGSWTALIVVIPVSMCFLLVIFTCCKMHEPWKPSKQLDLEGNRVTTLNFSQIIPANILSLPGAPGQPEQQSLLADEDPHNQLVGHVHA
eukprot:TRINITY_DN13846_c0_g1_i4.p1 TRINITY_DN13846_c0_g1~~TRINITY_DN13846_c0_g1_i4.p1  ORF type:complete len:527 (-),score=84.09 TRINITY_DN13846_c0_g1_i4:204-1784(-)